MGADPVLEHGGRDVFAARGHDQLLLPAGHPQVAFVVEVTDVARAQPAVGGQRLGCRAVVVPVTDEPVVPGEEDLPVLGDPHGHARQRLADGSDLVAAGAVHRGGGGGLGEAVSLDDGDPGAAEEMAEPVSERRTAGH